MTGPDIFRDLSRKDAFLDREVRPRDFEGFIGQNKVKEKLGIFVDAALQRKEALDHTLFSGPPGLGKTTLAYIIASTMQTDIRTASGPAIEKAGDIAGLLTNLEEGNVLFIDEIHRLNRSVEEYLYTAMEEYRLDIVIDKGPSARTIRLEIPRFTLIGATTRSGLLTAPLRSRFGIKIHLDFYPQDELSQIVKRSAGILGIEISEKGAEEIAVRSRGTPRIANNLLRRVRDFAQVRADNIIVDDVARQALEILDIDSEGLDQMDKKILQTIILNYEGGPVGLNTLSVSVGEEEDTIEEVYEPFLIQSGFLKRTPSGRVATEKAYRHFQIKNKKTKNSQIELFKNESPEE
ncbi:MAG: Holliday junction branch migration DNA helicase RuvB [Candidatus Aureabacteria bacterium]|nr:Holliday junction branch migration DNA helicase RuvB [Candidatus Auribacterota bacterium]